MDDEKNIYLRLGEMLGAQKSIADAVKHQTLKIDNLAREVQESASGFSKLADGLKAANKDIIAMRDSVITPDKLRKVGIDIDDADNHKLDMDHLRDLRESHEKNSPASRSIKTAIITAILVLSATSIYSWASRAIWEGVKQEVSNNGK